MAVFKKHLTAVGKAGQIVKHQGKGAVAQPLTGTASGGGASTMNDYAQATPMAAPQDAPSNPFGGQ